MKDTAYLSTMNNTDLRRAISYLTYKMVKRTITEEDKAIMSIMKKELNERRSYYDKLNDSINGTGRKYRPGSEAE